MEKELAKVAGSERQLRLLGFLPLVFFTAQALHYWQINELGQALWMCNIGNLLLAVGLFLEEALLIRVAVIWMIPGVAVWFVYVVPTWGTLLTGEFGWREYFGVISSTLAHLGGMSVGLLVLRKVRMDDRAWLYAVIWYFLVQLLSRIITPAAINVNVAHKVQDGWEQTFSSYLKFWLVLTLLVSICLWIMGRLLKMLWPIETKVQKSRGKPTFLTTS
jgi:hypothetical protein